jgi:hypothetical protein
MRARIFLLGVIVLLLVGGCSSDMRTVRVEIPPRVNLGAYPIVGLVTFSSNLDNQTDQLSTREFLTQLQAAQPGTRVLELGSQRNALASVNAQSWDPAALHALKAARGVDVLVIGTFTAEKKNPDVHLSSFLKSLNVRQDVKASLNARLIETATGATVWTNGAQTTSQLAGANFSAHGGSLSANDPQEVYGQMIDDLACRITEDFRPHYVRREVPREQLTVAQVNPQE